MVTDTRTSIGILGTGSHLPDQETSNEVVAAAAGVTPDWIEAKTGIQARRTAPDEDAASDLALRASLEALAKAGISADQLTAVVVATSTPDFPQPPTACVLQHKLSIPRAVAFDINAVCSGFVFALDAARRLVAAGGYALVVGVDIYTRILDPSDRRTAPLFGDGAGAVVLGPVPEGRGIRAVQLASYGDHHDLIMVPAGGSRIPASKDSVLAGQHYFTMDGRGVREFVQRELPGAVHGFLADNEIDTASIRHFVPHQANGRMLADLERELELPRATAHYTVEQFGNTGAASVPVTLNAASEHFQPGDPILIAAFGGGMSTGLAVVDW